MHVTLTLALIRGSQDDGGSHSVHRRADAHPDDPGFQHQPFASLRVRFRLKLQAIPILQRQATLQHNPNPNPNPNLQLQV